MGSSVPSELDFWDDELIAEGSCIMAQRVVTVGRLSELAGPIHRQLSGKEEAMEVVYRPNVDVTGESSVEAAVQTCRHSRKYIS